MRAKAGRVLSIVGHPLLLLPLAIAIATSRESSRDRVVILGLAIAAMLVVMAYVIRRMRRGELADIDVSTREQRPAVFAVAIVSLVVSMIALRLSGTSVQAFRGAAVTTALFAASAVVNRWLKASLHAAFVMLAAGIVWPADARIGVAFVVAAFVVGWGRVAYRRHTTREVMAGLALGAVAGSALVYWTTRPA